MRGIARHLLLAACLVSLAVVLPAGAEAKQGKGRRAVVCKAKRAKKGKRARRVCRRVRARRPARRPVRRVASSTGSTSTTSNAPTPAVQTDCHGVNEIPTSSTLGPAQETIVCLLNNERAKAGLGALRIDSELTSAAVSHSRDMVAGGYFEHTSLQGRTVVDRISGSGYLSSQGSWVVGENIAWGTGSYATLASIVVSWMNSPHHRDNILNGQFRDIGSGIAVGVPEAGQQLAGATFTTDFGARG